MWFTRIAKTREVTLRLRDGSTREGWVGDWDVFAKHIGKPMAVRLTNDEGEVLVLNMAQIIYAEAKA